MMSRETLWIPGPTEVDLGNLEAMSTPVIGHRSPETGSPAPISGVNSPQNIVGKVARRGSLSRSLYRA